ncbi:MAG: C25 family cysteine peptidase, partial [Planctomycetota bacterium]
MVKSRIYIKEMRLFLFNCLVLFCALSLACAFGEDSIRVQINGYGIACIDYADVAGYLTSPSIPTCRIALLHRGEPVPVLFIGDEEGSFDRGDSILFFSELSASRYTNTNVYSLLTDSDRGTCIELPAPPSADLPVTLMEQADQMYLHTYSHLFARSRMVEVNIPCDYTSFRTLNVEIVPVPGSDPSETLVIETPMRRQEVRAQDNGTWRFEYSLNIDGTVGKNVWFRAELPEATESYNVFLKEPRGRDNRFAIYLDMKQDQGLVLFPGFPASRYFAWHVEEKKLLWTEKRVQGEASMLGLLLEKGKSQVFISSWEKALRPARVYKEEGADLPIIETAYLAVTPRKFMDSLNEHLEYRKCDLGSVSVVPLETIYSHYSHGEPDPQAIRTFMEEKAWNVKYLLLIGAARERVNAGYSRPYAVPSEYYDTFDLLPPMPYMYRNVFVPCDTLFGDLDLDGVPEIAVGRIPCATEEELKAVLQKIRDYEANPAMGEQNKRIFLQAGIGRFDAYGG